MKATSKDVCGRRAGLTVSEVSHAHQRMALSPRCLLIRLTTGQNSNTKKPSILKISWWRLRLPEAWGSCVSVSAWSDAENFPSEVPVGEKRRPQLDLAPCVFSCESPVIPEPTQGKTISVTEKAAPAALLLVRGGGLKRVNRATFQMKSHKFSLRNKCGRRGVGPGNPRVRWEYRLGLHWGHSRRYCVLSS